MIDIAVCVMVYPPDTSAMPPEQARRMWIRGDIVQVHPIEKLVGPPNLTIRPNGTGPGRLRYIKITSVPATLDQLRVSLLEKVDHDNDPTTPGRSRWKGDALLMANSHPQKYAELRDTGVTDLTWEQVKGILHDWDNVFITDADLTAPHKIIPELE